jgi:phenylpropionate dioxygenase-like ring-hydroxylating dioxygenase large terminal subunit
VRPIEETRTLVTRGRLEHLLPPSAYFEENAFKRERERLLTPAWHLVGTTAELKRPGDFLTIDLLGRAVLVRNFEGEIVALSNVCAHRHCLLRNRPSGRDSRLACPYHGWEFGADGRTREIPAPKNFVPFDREADALPVYRVGLCGQLVFVCLDPKAPALESQLGSFFATCLERFSVEWKPTLRAGFDIEANWKVPVENSLEEYHLAQVHPYTFGEDPGEERSLHEIQPGFTTFSTTHFASKSRLDRWLHRCEASLLRALGRGQQGRYFHYHVYPHLLFSFTDTLSLVQCVLPDGPRKCRVVVRQFGPGGRLRPGPLRALAALWGFVGARITLRILSEDLVILPSVQKGLEASPHAGVLGYGERRIHAFQQHVKSLLDGA